VFVLVSASLIAQVRVLDFPELLESAREADALLRKGAQR
jgi:hypothetical protein